MPTCRSCLRLCFLALTGSLAAQPASSTFRTSLLESVSIGYSYSSREGISYGSGVGEVAVQRFDYSLNGDAGWYGTVFLRTSFWRARRPTRPGFGTIVMVTAIV